MVFSLKRRGKPDQTPLKKKGLKKGFNLLGNGKKRTANLSTIRQHRRRAERHLWANSSGSISRRSSLGNNRKWRSSAKRHSIYISS